MKEGKPTVRVWFVNYTQNPTPFFVIMPLICIDLCAAVNYPGTPESKKTLDLLPPLTCCSSLKNFTEETLGWISVRQVGHGGLLSWESLLMEKVREAPECRRICNRNNKYPAFTEHSPYTRHRLSSFCFFLRVLLCMRWRDPIRVTHQKWSAETWTCTVSGTQVLTLGRLVEAGFPQQKRLI